MKSTQKTKREAVELHWFSNLFCKYLLNNKVTPKQFFYNCLMYDDGISLLHFLRQYDMSNYGTIIDCSFTWVNTPEGGDFWCNLDSDFRRFYRKAYEDFYVKYIVTNG